MTAVTVAAMPAASMPQSPSMQSDATTAAKPADVTAAPDAGSPSSGSGEVARQTPARTQGTAAKQDGAASTSGPDDFATLLLAGTDGSAVTAPSMTATAPVPPDEKRADVAASDAGGLPDQLLALLDGPWLQPSLQAEAAVAPAPQMAQGASQVAAASNLAAADRRPALDPAALQLAVQTDASAAPAEIAVTDASSAGALATATTSDTNAPISSFHSLVPAMANTPAARAIMAAPISVPADPQSGFDDGFGARLVWMAEQRLGHAEIRLNPEHLGPIEVRVQMDGTQVSAEFQSGHAGVRQAIEASLPRLREMLGQQGLQLGQTDVGQRHAGSGAPARRDGDTPSQGGSPIDAQLPSRYVRTRGLLDEYA
ncbi:MAG TPA: flagellar hook-length control protein FliK [Lysobacter sp.]